jgi:TatD DNase family protein
MYIDIHTHKLPKTTEDILSVFNLNVPDYFCRRESNPEGMNYSLGIHPWGIKEQLLPENLRRMEEYASLENIRAIGECGLDKLTATPWELQTRAFRAQITISERVKKPLIIHCVKALDEIIALKKESKPEQTWIIHGFRGKPEQRNQLIEHGFYLSFGEYFNEETIVGMPPEKLFLETDDGELGIRQVYEKTARTLRVDLDTLIAQISKNVQALSTATLLA